MGGQSDSVAGPRSQVGIGTLIVFVAMVIVAVLAGGVLIETAGLLQSDGERTGAESSSQVTDRVRIASATATYSDGSMTAIEIDVTKESGSGDIELSNTLIHWLGPNGSSELTSATFSVTAIRGSGTVIRSEADLMTVSNLGKTLPDGTPATVRFVTADGGVTTAVLKSPNTPPTDGAVSLLWRSPSGNPGHASTPTPTPMPSLNQEWVYEDSNWNADAVAAESGTGLYIKWVEDGGSGDTVVQELDPTDGSFVAESDPVTIEYFDVTAGDDPTWNVNSYVYWWDTSADNVDYVLDASSDAVAAIEPQGGDFYLGVGSGGGVHKYNSDATKSWEDSSGDSNAVDASSSAVYGGIDESIKRYDHDGTEQWSTSISSSQNEDIAVGPNSHVYAAMSDGDVFQLDKNDGSQTRLFTSSSGQSNLDVETGPDGNVYVTDGGDMVVIDPTDGSTIVTESFGNSVTDIEARTDGIYVVTDSGSLTKYTKTGF